LEFTEFEQRMGQTLFVSATPSRYEDEHSTHNLLSKSIVLPVYSIRKIDIRPVEDQIADFNL